MPVHHERREELKGKVNVVPEMNDVIDAAIKYNGGKHCDMDKEVLKKAQVDMFELTKIISSHLK